jgi:glycerophosphoryl diester phosphodiesterase
MRAPSFSSRTSHFTLHTSHFTLACAAWFLCMATWAVDAPKPLVRAHAHNDYIHQRPLLDALDQGFCSVEADIHLVDGQLLVAHDLDKTRPDRTLQSLYLDPLRERIKANGGRVYRDGPPCTLLIDIKTDSKTTYPALHQVLEKYADILTVFKDGIPTPAAITVIVDNARDLIAAQSVRYATIDGSYNDLDSDASANLIPWISMEWKGVFKWNGQGPMPEDERAKLREMVKKAHDKGRKIRFWGLPLRPTAIWPELYDAGVDLLNADDLKGMKEFLLGREGK